MQTEERDYQQERDREVTWKKSFQLIFKKSIYVNELFKILLAM